MAGMAGSGGAAGAGCRRPLSGGKACGQGRGDEGGVKRSGDVAAGRGEDIAPVAPHVEAGSEGSGAVADRASGVGEVEVASPAAGANGQRGGEWPVSGEQAGEALLTTMARIDVDDDEAAGG